MLIYEIGMNGMKMDYFSTIIIKPPRPFTISNKILTYLLYATLV